MPKPQSNICPTCGQAKKKTDPQRRKWHAMLGEISKHIGETPGKVKEAIKQDFFGLDEYRVGKKWYRAVKPSESADRPEYSQLIDYTYSWCHENGLDMVWKEDRKAA